MHPISCQVAQAVTITTLTQVLPKWLLDPFIQLVEIYEFQLCDKYSHDKNIQTIFLLLFGRNCDFL